MQLHSEARGMTPWARLQNYNVKFDHSVNVVVQMDVHRETGDLLPNELKLVVMQVSARPPAPLLCWWAQGMLSAHYRPCGAITSLKHSERQPPLWKARHLRLSENLSAVYVIRTRPGNISHAPALSSLPLYAAVRVLTDSHSASSPETRMLLISRV